MGDKKCFVVKDLLPLYQDEVLSEESKQFVEAHLKECQDCRQYKTDMEHLNFVPIPDIPDSKEELDKLTDQAETLHMKNIASRLRKRRYRNLAEIVAVILLLFILFTQVFQNVIIYGGGMEPKYRSGQYVLINKLAYLVTSPKRGDVILYRHEGDLYIKRIIGVPGDEVNFSENEFLINDKPVRAGYVPSIIDRPGDISYPVKLGKDEYFVKGDNAKFSIDSRYSEHGMIKRKEIRGKILCKSIEIIKITEDKRIKESQIE